MLNRASDKPATKPATSSDLANKMNTSNISKASEYVNSLLLSRGLLKHGKSIDFAASGSDSGSPEALARIINLIHDLIIRRDKESDQRDVLSSTIRQLQTTDAKRTSEIERLETKNVDLTRSLALAESQKHVFQATVRSAEATSKGLKDQIMRLKISIQQIRSQCATDIRKRDIEMHKLKSHLADQQRGKKEGLGVTTITITPSAKSDSDPSKASNGGEHINSPKYSLKQETTEFLTQLCQNLSDENDAMIGIVKHTLQTLKDLLGTTEELGQREDNRELDPQSTKQDSPITQHRRLSQNMNEALNQLKDILTNPSYVPLEEVEARDNEIFRLRKGWEKMETKWKEAVKMMDVWYKKVAVSGGKADLEELRASVGLDIDFSKERAKETKLDAVPEEQEAEEEAETAEKTGKGVPQPLPRRQKLGQIDDNHSIMNDTKSPTPGPGRSKRRTNDAIVPDETVPNSTATPKSAGKRKRDQVSEEGENGEMLMDEAMAKNITKRRKDVKHRKKTTKPSKHVPKKRTGLKSQENNASTPKDITKDTPSKKRSKPSSGFVQSSPKSKRRRDGGNSKSSK